MANARGRSTLERLESRVNQLPLLPDVVVALLRLDPLADDYFDRVAALVRADPAFAMRLLRFANSASLAAARPVGTIDQALMLVGCRGAVELVLGHSAMRVFVPQHDWERDLWRHAFDVACLMQAFAAMVASRPMDAHKAYLFGLLHDIGRFILYLEAPDELRRVDETSWSTPQELIDAETAICGFTHAELGYLAVRKWRLPEELAEVVRDHHLSPGDPRLAPLRPVIQLIQDADWLSMTLAVHQDLWRSLATAELLARMAPRDLRARYGLADESLLDLVRRALQHSVHMQQSLGIAATDQSTRAEPTSPRQRR